MVNRRSVVAASIAASILVLAVSAAVPPLGVQSQTEPKPIMVWSVSIEPGDVLAPHLYTWYFDWGQYIQVSNPNMLPINCSGSPLVIVSKVLLSAAATGGTPRIVTIIANNGYTGIYFSTYGTAVFTVHRTYSDGRYITASIPYSLGSWALVRGAVNYSAMTISIVDLVSGASASNNIYDTLGSVSYISIASPETSANQFRGYISFVALGYGMSFAVYGNAFIISNASMLLDPTFFNGTHYIDLSGNNNNGVPYGGVQRVPDNSTWIWVIKGLYSDNYVHLLYFPYYTVVKFKDQNGNVVASVYVTSVHETVSIPPGSYTIEVYQFPLTVTTTTTTTIAETTITQTQTQTVTTTTTETLITTTTVTETKTLTETTTTTATVTQTETITIPITTTVTTTEYVTTTIPVTTTVITTTTIPVTTTVTQVQTVTETRTQTVTQTQTLTKTLTTTTTIPITITETKTETTTQTVPVTTTVYTTEYHTETKTVTSTIPIVTTVYTTTYQPVPVPVYQTVTVTVTSPVGLAITPEAVVFIAFVFLIAAAIVILIAARR